MSPARRAELRGWVLLAGFALAAAGVLALLLGLSRTPGVGEWLPWGAHFFHRALVTHVVLSFQVWFLAVLGALSALAAPEGDRTGRAGLGLSTLGVLALLVPALADQGEPSLNNYVPVVTHPLFYLGLALLAGGVMVACARTLPLLARPRCSAAGEFGIACAGLAFGAALLSFAAAWVLIPAGLDGPQVNEVLFWGGGHVLQLVNTLILLIAWQRLAEGEWGRGLLPDWLAKAVFASLALAALGALLIFAFRPEVTGFTHRQAFTDLLWLGLPLPPLVMGAGLALRVIRGPRRWASPAFLAMALSLAVFAIGGLAGFFLGMGDTRTPSHYHAVIGGVQLGLMGLIMVHILPLLGSPLSGGRAERLQFHLYGWGQMIHATGFFLAGAAGVPRKTAGAAQGLDSLWKQAAMGVVGLGTGLAVLGGAVFVWLVLSRLLRRGG